MVSILTRQLMKKTASIHFNSCPDRDGIKVACMEAVAANQNGNQLPVDKMIIEIMGVLNIDWIGIEAATHLNRLPGLVNIPLMFSDGILM